MFDNILQNLQATRPLVHCITNYVTANDVANAVLACGASPIMADDSDEVEEITSLCTSLVINIGTLNKRSVQSMLLAGKRANALSHPVVLDPVGIGASRLRTQTALHLLEQIHFDVIRGNSSEIKTLAGQNASVQGVDADIADSIHQSNLDQYIALAQALSLRYNAVVAITGAIDIVADNEKAFVIYNGHPLMSKITGTGCMLSGLLGGFVGANPKDVLLAAAAAVSLMGLCGQLAHEKMLQFDGGTSLFRTFLIDAISNMTTEILKRGVQIEVR